MSRLMAETGAFLSASLDDVFVTAPRAGMRWEHRAKAPLKEGDPPRGTVVSTGMVLRADRLSDGWYVYLPTGSGPQSGVPTERWERARDGRALLPQGSLLRRPGAELHWDTK